jgi:hypothetical protein
MAIITLDLSVYVEEIMSDSEIESENEFLVTAGRALFSGSHPTAQGAALAELTAIWLAGHPFKMWEGIIKLQIDTIIELATNIKKELG